VNQSRLEAVPSLALGTSSVTLLEMASAYSTIARLGEYHEPVFVKRITDRAGNVLAEFGAPPRRAMSAQSAALLVDMMRDVIGMGTGYAIRGRFGIAADVAGKTGTTQNNTDGWFILMHPQLVAGAWVGFNDARVTMRSAYWGQGGHNAILLVGDFFRAALKDKLIDVKAEFPRRSRSAILATVAMPNGNAGEEAEDQSAPPASKGNGVIVIEGAGDAAVPGASTKSGGTLASRSPLEGWERVETIPRAEPDHLTN
jgi:penicillin-binding protein 1A